MELNLNHGFRWHKLHFLVFLQQNSFFLLQCKTLFAKPRKLMALIKKMVIGFAVLALSYNTSNAQFLNKDATWNVYYQGVEGGADKIINLKIEKDSLINDTLYSIFNFVYDRYALREERNKVFFRLLKSTCCPEFDTSEHLLYDFGLELNDSISLNLLWNDFYTTKKWKVTDVDSVLVGKEYKKRILLKFNESAIYPMEGVQYWIKDVGSSEGPLYFTGISEFETVIHLYCYQINGELRYSTEISGGKCKTEFDKISNLLHGEWSWYDSGGGLSGNGFGGPKENGYSVNVKIEKDLLRGGLMFWDYVSDSLVRQGKAAAHFYEKDSSVFEINSVLPAVHDSYFVRPFDAKRMIHFEFLSNDTIRFYHAMCADCFEVYYKRQKNLGAKQSLQMESELKFFPNPAKNQITISNLSNIPIKTIDLIDFSGRVVQIWEALELAGNTLNIQHIQPGIYLLKATTETGIQTMKLVVE